VIKPHLKKHRVDSLVERFRSHALEQEQALLHGNQAKVNELYWQLKAVREELKSRRGDQRSALLRLYEDPSPQVRVKAIKATLALAPEKARKALEHLANSKEYPASGEAGMSLWALDGGVFKPS
jgi:CHASE3 domain sensor protein